MYICTYPNRRWRSSFGLHFPRRVLLQDFLALLAEALGSWPPEPCFVLSGRWGNNTEVGGGSPGGARGEPGDGAMGLWMGRCGEWMSHR